MDMGGFGGMADECCPMKKIWGSMDPKMDGMYVLAGWKNPSMLPKRCNNGCIYKKKDSNMVGEYCFGDSFYSQSYCDAMQDGEEPVDMGSGDMGSGSEDPVDMGSGNEDPVDMGSGSEDPVNMGSGSMGSGGMGSGGMGSGSEDPVDMGSGGMGSGGMGSGSMGSGGMGSGGMGSGGMGSGGMGSGGMGSG